MYKKYNYSYNNGFTLLELLIVIAIIGILTTIIIASLGSSNARAKDAKIKSELKQFEILLNLEYSENGDYSRLQTTGGNFITSDSGCDSAFVAPPVGSNYYAKAREICKIIIENSPKNNGVSWGLIADTSTNMGVPRDDKYSVMATLNDAPYGIAPYFCVGISGSSTGTAFNGKGCWSNP
jgi:prepilin-type N-terminal cleavage/methylation domain-containing protein